MKKIYGLVVIALVGFGVAFYLQTDPRPNNNSPKSPPVEIQPKKSNQPITNVLPEFHIMTEDWMPYQFERDGELHGIAVDLLVLMLKRAGSHQSRKDIVLLPWARGYRTLQTDRNTILFSTTRTIERDEMFKWVGPIFQNQTFLIAKKSKKIKIASKDDIKNYQVGTILEDASEMFMTRLGINLDNLQRTNSSINNVRKIDGNRIDIVVSGWIAFKNDCVKAGVAPSLYEKIFLIDTSDVSYAFHKETPEWIILKFQEALDAIKDEGLLDKIVKDYSTPDWSLQ